MKTFIVVDLQFGDAGKGTTVDYLCSLYPDSIIVRYCGGFQSGHNVVLPDGRHHCFSQFGSGAFHNALTYLDKNFIVSPPALDKEAEHLHSLGVENPYNMIYVHPSCLISTSLHMLANRALEYIRGVNRHGSCGVGIGQTREYWLKYGDDAIFARDLENRSVVLDKLRLMQARLLVNMQEMFQYTQYCEYMDHLYNWNLYDEADRLSLSDVSNFELTNDTIVFEGSQGVLLDEYHGFHPHTTWSTVTQKHALEFMREHNIESDNETIGVTRTYTTRHGAGPLPTYDSNLYDYDHNKIDKWQGNFRIGYLDISLLKYAHSIVKPDCLMVTHTDVDFGKYASSVDNLCPYPCIESSRRRNKQLCSSVPHYYEGKPLDFILDNYNVKYLSSGRTYKDKMYSV